MRSTVLVVCFVSAVCSGLVVHRSAAELVPERAIPADPFAGLKFRSIGPPAGGRICRVAGVAGDPLVYYAATAGSGVWKSSDGGLRWKPILDDHPAPSVGAIAVAPSDPNVLYVGGGEANIRGNVQVGHGIYKSTDAGKTWTHVWKEMCQIGTMAVHQNNPDIAFAAVLGRAFGPSDNRGVYRTTDGGKNWRRVLFKNRETGASDLCLDPSNPRIIFAGFWQTVRKPWSLTSGGPGSGLFVSRDGGDSWKELTGEGLPAKPWGRVGVAVAPSDGRRVYAVVEAEKGGLFTSSDGGQHWTLASADRGLRQRAWYYSTLVVDPTNPNIVWAPQVPLLKSIDGGKTFQKVAGTHHGDHHDVWIDPKNPKRIIEGNDGGVDLSMDGGESWFAPPLPIAQFYRIAVDQKTPFRVFGTMQDIGSTSGPSNSLATGGIDPADWTEVGGGEAGYVVVDRRDDNIVFAGEYDGIFTRFDRRTGASRHVGVYPFNSSGHGAEDKKYRFRWPAPAAGSPHDPSVLYHAGNVLFRSQDGGQTWTALGPDLTRNDKSKQQWSGGPITGDNTGAEHYGTLSAIAESPKKAAIIWTGSDDGLVHVSQDAGKTWVNVTPNIAQLPEWGTVQHIEPSRFDEATAYIVVDAHLMDDHKPYLWVTRDFGKKWVSLSGSLPEDLTLHVIREAAADAKFLFLGTERGVYFSRNAGSQWLHLKLNLPPAAVHDLLVVENQLVVSTMGRSIWMLDDWTPIKQVVESLGDAHLFAPPAVTKWNFRSTAKRPGSGENPPGAAVVWYRLKADAKDVKAEILNAQGVVIAELEGEKDEDANDDDEDKEDDKKRPLPSKAGLHRVLWDFRGKAPKKIAKAKIDAGNLDIGPPTAAGQYTVRLTIAGKAMTAPLEVRADPRVTVTSAELDQQNVLTTRVRDEITKLTSAVERLRSVRNQLKARNEVLAKTVGAEGLLKASKDAVEQLDQLEKRLHNPDAKVTYDILSFKGGAKLYSQLSSLYSFVGDGFGAPTQGAKDVLTDYEKELSAVLADLDRFYLTVISDLNLQAKAKDWPTTFVPTMTEG